MIPDGLGALAKEKSHGSAALEKQWALALQRLRSSHIREDDFAKLVAAANSPGALSRLAGLLADGSATPGDLFLSCDDSSHGLDQWIEALEVVCVWLDRKGRRETLAKSIGYVSCSSQAAPEAKLSWIVAQMLDQYGMDK